MAYGDAFDVTSPADGDFMSLGDDAIRKLARAIHQRLESIIVDVDADPMVLKPAAVTPPDGTITGPKLAPALKLRSVVLVDQAAVGSLGAYGTTVMTVAVPGASLGDTVLISANSIAGAALLLIHGLVTAADTVDIQLYNAYSGITNYNTTLKIAVIKASLL